MAGKLVLLLKAPATPPPGTPLVLVTTSPLPQAIQGVFYTVTFQASGGDLPYLWSKPSGSFPGGLNLSNNVLSGTPTVSGSFSFPIRLIDSDTPTPTQIDRTYDLAIAAAPTVLTVLTSSLQPGTVGQFQSTQMQAAGGTGPYTWTLESGTRPPGMNFSPTGLYSGTPTTAGTYVFKFRVTDTLSAFALSGQFTVTITADTLTFVTSVLPFAPLNTPYDAQLLAANYTAPLLWRFVDGNPPWLTLNAATGDLGGTSPSTPADYQITIGLSDAGPAPEVVRTLGLRVLTEGPHDFYNERVAAGYIAKAHDCRTQAGLDQMVKVPPSLYWKYLYSTDPDPQKQDAAKLVKPPRRMNLTAPYTPMGLYEESKGRSATVGNEGINTDKQLIVLVGKNSGRLLFTWDIWFGGEYYDNNGTDGFDLLRMNALKAFWSELSTPAGNPPGTGEVKHHSLIHIRLRAQQIDGSLGDIGRLHDQCDIPTGVPRTWAGLAGTGDNYSPTLNPKYPTGSYRIKRNRWTRFWHLIEMGVPADQFTEWNAVTGQTLAPLVTTVTSGGVPAGTAIPFNRHTRWMADEDRDPERVFGPVPFPHHPAYPYIGRYVFRWDTSTENWFLFPEVQEIDLNNIGPGHTFTLTMPAFTTDLNDPPNASFPAYTSTTVSYSTDMASAISGALAALPSIFEVSAVKGAGHRYTLQYTGVGTRVNPHVDLPTVIVNPSGFTPNAVVVVQDGGRQAVPHKGLREPIKSYHRNITFEYNVPLEEIVLANTSIFRRPVGN